MSKDRGDTTVSIPKDVLASLHNLRHDLSDWFGFTPTVAQTIKYLIKLHK